MIPFWAGFNQHVDDDEYGVFTHKRGTVFAGSHANGSALVGVNTKTSGTMRFVECDADGQYDGRYLRCDADGTA